MQGRVLNLALAVGSLINGLSDYFTIKGLPTFNYYLPLDSSSVVLLS